MKRLLQAILILMVVIGSVGCYKYYNNVKIDYESKLRQKNIQIVELNSRVSSLNKTVLAYDDNRKFVCNKIGVGLISNKK